MKFSELDPGDCIYAKDGRGQVWVVLKHVAGHTRWMSLVDGKHKVTYTRDCTLEDNYAVVRGRA
jgi:hypothetical protein